MAFWDELSQKASATSAKAVQKAKDFSEITRLNGAINEEQSKLRSLCSQIGEQYVAIHAADAAPQFADAVKAVQDTKAKIAELQKEVRFLRGVTVCPKCGTELPMGSRFCTNCGAQIPQEEPPASYKGMKRCPNCGNLIDKDARFCTNCGAQLQPASEASTQAAQSAPAPESAPVQAAPAPESAPAQSAPAAESVPFQGQGESAPAAETSAASVTTETAAEPAAAEAAPAEPASAEPESAPAAAPAPEAPAAEAQPAPDAQSAQSPAPGTVRCPNCGAIVPEGYSFCTNCGAKL